MLKRNVVLVMVALTGGAASYGQAGFGTLTGTVTDSTQAVIANAQVVLTLPNGEQRTTTTNGSGTYLFTALPPGAGYTESITLSGFETSKVKDLSVSVGTTVTQNAVLTPGAESQSITVSTANVEQVQTDTSSVSQLVDSTIWQNSPLEDRSQNNFITLVAGATPDTTTGRGAAVSGARTGTGNFLVEGMDNNDQGQGGAGTTFGQSGPNSVGGAVTTISPDAIQEYRVITHNPSAEYGRAGGFSTDTALKSGTNKFHGSLFEYNRIQALDANSWFSNYGGTQDRRIRNQFGGSVGGPIYKDRTFFFTTLEFHRYRLGEPLQATAVTQDFLNFVSSGAFETFQETNPAGACIVNTTIPATATTPAVPGTPCPGALSGSATLGTNFLQKLKLEPSSFPVATEQFTNTAGGLFTSGIQYPVPIFGQVVVNEHQAVNQERASVKIDHKLTEKDQISATYLLDFETQAFPYQGGGGTIGPDEDQVGGSQLFTISETHTFSPNLQNVFRAGYTRHVSNFTSPATTDGIPETVSAFDALATSFGASAGLPQFFTENEFLYEDSLSKTIKSHNIKAGFRFIRTRNGSVFVNDFRGTLLPYDTEGFLTDGLFDDQLDQYLNGGSSAYGGFYEASASIDTTDNQLPSPYRGYRANELSAYVQDNWTVNKHLTLNLGVRWDYFGPPHNAQPGLDSNVYFGAFAAPTANGNPFLPNTPITGAIQTATFIQKNSDIWNKDTNNFGPRLGFSYDPTGLGKTALRAGFGIGYDRLYNNVYENIRFNSPHFADNIIGTLTSGIPAGPLEQPFLLNIPFNGNAALASAGSKPVPRHIDQNLVTAYYEQANFGLEQELAKGYVFEANYIGTFGRKLVGLRDVNNYDGRTACPLGSASAACAAAGYPNGFTSARPNRLFNGDNFRSNGFDSNYNGLQVSVRKGFSNGLMFLANYTWSKAFDEVSDVFTTKTTAQTGITDPINPKYDYGPADFDVRNLASFTMNYVLPYKEKNLLLGGWSISPIVSLASGTPFSVVDGESGYNPNQDGRPGDDRAVYVGQGTIGNAVHHSAHPGPAPLGVVRQTYLSASDFSAGPITAVPFTCPATVNQGLWCDPPAQRNAFYGPHNTNVDLGVGKHFHVTEAQSVIFQASFFNIFNHANFANPVSDVNNSEFGVSENTNNDPRITQLSLRYEF